MKLFKSNNIDIVRKCQEEFAFSLPSVLLAHWSEHFLVTEVSTRIVTMLFCKLLLF